jgi:hypothetical protein
LRVLVCCAFILAIAGGAAAQFLPGPPHSDLPTGHAPDDAFVARVLALDCASVSANDVALVLARTPAPRIILLQGSVAIVTMEPFAEFLVAMGYPASRIRNPADGKVSYSSFADSRQLAGEVAWYYESDGTMPMLIGHSQGGMMVVRVLHELAGAFRDVVTVWDPVSGTPTGRTAIRDPLTQDMRPVVGLQVDYAAAIATGNLGRLLLGQWDMLGKLRHIPDSVADFTAYSIPWDPIAGTFAHPPPYGASGAANVRNVILPAGYSHIGIPRTAHLAADAVTRAWIEAYIPGPMRAPMPDAAVVDTSNLLHAADIWYSVKEHWCMAGQRLLRARGGHGQ